MDEVINRTCTSKIFSRDKSEKDHPCGEELVVLVSVDGEIRAYLCPTCDALENLPKSMRERIKEQWEV